MLRPPVHVTAEESVAGVLFSQVLTLSDERGESGVAYGAAKRSLSRVLDQVAHQGVLVTELARTDLALEVFLLPVDLEEDVLGT